MDGWVASGWVGWAVKRRSDRDAVAGTQGDGATAHVWVGRTEGGTCRCDAVRLIVGWAIEGSGRE